MGTTIKNLYQTLQAKKKELRNEIKEINKALKTLKPQATRKYNMTPVARKARANKGWKTRRQKLKLLA